MRNSIFTKWLLSQPQLLLPPHFAESAPSRGKGGKRAHKPSGVAKMRRAARKARNLKRK